MMDNTTIQANYEKNESELRSLCRRHLQNLTRREPLDPTYKHLFLQSASAASAGSTLSTSALSGMLPKDSLYKDIKSNLRANVEQFLEKGGLDIPKIRGRERNSLNMEDEDLSKSNLTTKDTTNDGTTNNSNNTAAAMRAAFTLRETMRHEQEVFVSTFLAAETRQAGGYQAEAKRRKLANMAYLLQDRERRIKARALALKNALLNQEREKRDLARLKLQQEQKALEQQIHQNSNNSSNGNSKLDELKKKKLEDLRRTKSEEHRKKLEQKDRENDEKERLRQIDKQRERERQRELARLREEEDFKREAHEKQIKARMAETPREATHRLYQPIFKTLWDMEFSNLGGTNPFRIVIDKDNCVAMGVPDYADIIKQPMNLTYIQEKVENKTYVTLQAFLDDVKLLINNALLYNSDPNNQYHVAAKKMKKKFKKMVTHVLQGIGQNQLDESAMS